MNKYLGSFHHQGFSSQGLGDSVLVTIRPKNALGFPRAAKLFVFHCMSTSHQRCLPCYSDLLIGSAPFQKDFFLLVLQEYKYSFVPNVGIWKLLDSSIFERSKKWVEICCSHMHVLFVFTDTHVNRCCNFPKYVSSQDMPTFVYQLRLW